MLCIRTNSSENNNTFTQKKNKAERSEQCQRATGTEQIDDFLYAILSFYSSVCVTQLPQKKAESFRM